MAHDTRIRTRDIVMIEASEIVETFAPVHPGAILREEFMEPLGLTASRVAKAIGISRSRIERIVAEEIGISGDTAVRLGRLFDTSPQFWMNLQQHHDLERAIAAVGDEVERIVPLHRAA